MKRNEAPKRIFDELAAMGQGFYEAHTYLFREVYDHLKTPEQIAERNRKLRRRQ